MTGNVDPAEQLGGTCDSSDNYSKNEVSDEQINNINEMKNNEPNTFNYDIIITVITILKIYRSLEQCS